MKLAAALIVVLLAGVQAHARVFNFKESRLAAYLRTTGGLSSIGQSAFKESVGTSTVDGSSKLDYSGELGFMLGLGPDFHIRLGAELIQVRPVSDAPGTNAAGTQQFVLNSSVSAFNPNLSFEYAFETQGNLRFYASAGGGLADVTVENKYTMASGNSYGLSDFNELMSGSGVSATGAVGVEALFTDNVTCALDLGYRYLPISKLKYKGDANTILVPGGVHKGDPVLNSDGSNRSLDLSGLTIGITFRFYLKFI